MRAHRRIFVAGATGLTGRTLVRRAIDHGVDVVAHARPTSRDDLPFPTVRTDLADERETRHAMDGCTTVVQLIGTMRKRFGSGDTYASSDIGTTRQLLTAARGTDVDHIVLLSSVGAGRPMGAYLRAKAEAERLVRDAGFAWTTLRPGAFVNEERPETRWFAPFLSLLRNTNLGPIRTDELAAALLLVAVDRAPLDVALEGPTLFRVVDAARARGYCGAP